jgi:hypothetical protein
MTTTDEVAGIIGEIESAESAHDPVEQTEISDPKAEGAESENSGTTESEDENKNTDSNESNTKTEDVEAQDTGNADKADSKTDATSTETDAHSKDNETSQEENKTDAVDWKVNLPPPPPDYAGKEPEVDPETGQITNMTPQEYTEYVTEKARVGMRQEAYNNSVETRALDVAEQILPEIKTNPGVRKMVESARIASILSGNAIDTVQAAQQVKEALGITTDKILEAKTEGANNAKASIQVQKNAALETGSAQKGAGPDKVKDLQKRIARGDDLAFAELLGIIDK